ncbi:MAG: TonB-dependent receptor [Vicinamibacteria bacterium]
MIRSAFLLSLLLATSVFAQEGSLTGTVRTSDGVPLPQILLTLSGPSGPRTVVTGPEGRYRAAALAAGAYVVSAEAPGLVAAGPREATVGTGETRLDLSLAPAAVREHVLVSATRSEAAASTLGNAVSVLDRERIDERAASSALTLLQDLPGLATARTGALGAQGSVFVRGGESRFARILVDGVPVNQPGGAYDFGSTLPLEYERVEVVRGAASSLYGTDAMAGVVHFVTRRGDGPPSVRLEGEGGQNDWWRGQAATAGHAGALDWNAGLQRLQTDNDAPNTAFEQTAGALNLGASVGSAGTLRLVGRAESSTTGTPGQTAFGRPDLDAIFERDDRVGGASFRWAGARVSHLFRAGLAQTRQLSLNPLDSGSFTPSYAGASAPFPQSDFTNPLGFQTDLDRTSFGYQAEAQVGARHLLTLGGDVERETGELGSRADEEFLSPTRTNVGAYLQDRVVLGDRVYATVGGRVEHNDSFGTKVVPRAAVAWRVVPGTDATTLRASGGAGIKEPDFYQSYGLSFFSKGNPDLKAERSRTFDVGVEQRLAGGRVAVEATYFHHRYLDQIAYTLLDLETFQGSYTNLGETRAHGFELELNAAPTPSLTLSAHYTLTAGRVLVSTSDFDPVYAVDQPLLRRPQNQGGLSARWTRGRVTLGATLLAVGERADSDFAGLALDENEGYTRFDARARVRVTRQLEAFVVGENLADRVYMEALGYPALGRVVRAGLRFRTGQP